MQGARQLGAAPVTGSVLAAILQKKKQRVQEVTDHVPRPCSQYVRAEARPPDLERPDMSLGSWQGLHTHRPTSLLHKPRSAVGQNPEGTDLRKSPHCRYRVTCDTHRGWGSGKARPH